MRLLPFSYEIRTVPSVGAFWALATVPTWRSSRANADVPKHYLAGAAVLACCFASACSSASLYAT